ncbi:hypothetical protein [Thiobacillus sedimenti]|uniref:Lipoprotein n=1 Tax=Thiobacillus sedimenti TaxID=3110231 RepID=A0ABZ1CGG2_9PROT|nr:hypothetical protein [Thiobacillus sp. SCUT-2]WRS38459.1 hypothetical protein VA613_10635 [Thiobacillus sp. SCUT-2]
MNLRTTLLLGLLLALIGCSKLTLEHYNQISVGMSYDDVTRLIGPPDRCDDVMGVRSCDWRDGERSVHVNFLGGQVLLFSSSNLK